MCVHHNCTLYSTHCRQFLKGEFNTQKIANVDPDPELDTQIKKKSEIRILVETSHTTTRISFFDVQLSTIHM